MASAPDTLKRRPAETAGVLTGSAAIAAAIAARNWLAVGLAGVGYVPALVTFVVNHGGVRGLLGSIWRGK